MNKKVLYLVHGAVIAALYVVLTMLANALGLANYAIQVRFSEALTILPVFTPAAIPGLFLGCIISNTMTGCMLLDIIFGSLATLIGAFGTYLLRDKNKWLAPLPPIIANTIKLATFTRREEIAIMKMCGATNWFVRWPFLVEGMILGLTGGIIAFFCQWGIYGLIVKAIDQSDLLGIISTLPFSSMSHWILLVFLAAGFVIGAGGSVMAIRKFLKV